MIDKDQLIKDLGIEHLSASEQQAIYETYTYEVGAAISDGLTDEQLDEFGDIINGKDDVINAWLAAHEPHYRDDQNFKDLQEGYESDPEKVPAEKVYASIAWVRLNRPDFDKVVAQIKRELREQIASAS